MSKINTVKVPTAYTYIDNGQLVEVQELSNGSGLLLLVGNERLTVSYEQWTALRKCAAALLHPTELTQVDMES